MTNRITKINLDEGSIKRRSVEAEHEKSVAITDLLHENSFQPLCMKGGPYTLNLSISDGRLIFDMESELGETARAALSIAPLRGLIRDYFMICESYYQALKDTKSHKLEAINMARRGVHNEGAEALKELFRDRISFDTLTSRRLFTLICVLHIR